MGLEDAARADGALDRQPVPGKQSATASAGSREPVAPGKQSRTELLQPPDKTHDAARLRVLIASRQQPQIVELLARNANPEHMYALHRAYGSMMIPDVQGALTEASYLAKARVYLGEQLPLDAGIAARGADATAILDDLQRLPDARALALVTGQAVSVATWLPATATLGAVKQALRDRLDAAGYQRAMQLILDKADRALAMQVAPADPDVVTSLIDLDPAHPSPLALSPVAAARVDVAEARIRDADAGDWSKDPMAPRVAALALADLGRAERQQLAMRLRDRPLHNALRGVVLTADALERDDATVIQKVILDVQTLATLQRRASRGLGLDEAMARAGALVHAARARLEALPPSAPETERAAARAEVQRLEAMFFGHDAAMLAMVRTTAQRAGDRDGGVAAVGAQLRALGADSQTIAAEQLRAVPAGDGDALVAVLRKIATGDRLPAMQRAGVLDALASGALRLAPEVREQLNALVWQGAQLDAVPGPRAADAPIALPAELAPPVLGPRPEVVIALHDVLDAMDRRAVHEVLGRLARLPEADQRSLYADPRFRQKFQALPEGHARSAAGHFKESLRIAQRDGAEVALARYPTDIASEHDVHVEAIGAQVAAAGPDAQVRLRRAYVLVAQLGGAAQVRANPARLCSLPAEDRDAIQQLVLRDGGLLGTRDQLARADDQETASQLIFGQPGLAAPGAPGAADPATEAAFMYHRLREAAQIRDGVAVADWLSTTGPSADESLAEFMVLYQRVHPAGVRGGDLAQLADLYHRALRRLDSYRAAADALAPMAAQIVGATVATIVVTVASGGTLGPVAIGAMASLSAAASSAAAGAALRVRSTLGSMIKDAGTGAVEGLTATAGASLAARIVRGAATGLPAGRAAASIGARAVGHVGAGADIAASVIDAALGGASGELFQTATDEATWDRGVAEAFAAMLAAIARGAATGAAMGGAVGTLGVLGRALRGPAAEADHVATAAARDHAGTTSAKSTAPIADARPRVTPDRVVELSQRLQLPVELAPELRTGVELHYTIDAHRNIRPISLRVGAEALIDDVLAHGSVAARITRYNGALGKLRALWDRVVAFVRRTGRPPSPGTPLWKSHHELSKLDALITQRQAAHMASGLVDDATLDREIAFLESYRAEHEAIVADAEHAATAVEPHGHIDSPDEPRLDPATDTANHERGKQTSQPPTELTSPPPVGATTERDVTDKLATARPHLTETHFSDRAWHDTGPGQIIRVRDGRRQPTIAARQLGHLEPDAAHQAAGRRIARVEVLANEGPHAGAPMGELIPRDNPPYGVRQDIPVDPPTWVRLHFTDGSHMDWQSGPTPPDGFRFQITPNSNFRNYGFSGGHTRDAWNETMRVYGDQVREIPAQHLAFTLREHGAPIDVTIQPYEVRGTPDTNGKDLWTRVRYPKSIFENAGVSSIAQLEEHMTPYIVAELNAKPNSQTLDVVVPVRSLSGEAANLRLRIARDIKAPGRPFTSWWVSENNIDVRLLKPVEAPATKGQR